MFLELEERVRRLEEKTDRLVRVGVVTQVYPEKGSVRVLLPDADKEVSYELPVLVRKTLKDKDYWLPDVGEHVVCVFLPIGQEQGFVVGAFYSEVDKVPVISQDIKRIEFRNGDYMEYDRKNKKIRIFTQGTVEIEAARMILLKTTEVRLIGNLEVEGNIHATGSIIDEGGNTNHHSH